MKLASNQFVNSSSEQMLQSDFGRVSDHSILWMLSGIITGAGDARGAKVILIRWTRAGKKEKTGGEGDSNAPW